MPDEPTQITESNQLAEALEILRRGDQHLTMILAAWSAGGARGVRALAKELANGRGH